MLSAITEKLQSQRINDEKQFRLVHPSSGYSGQQRPDFQFIAPASRPLGQIQNEAAQTFAQPLFSNVASRSFGSKLAPKFTSNLSCTKMKEDKNEKENVSSEHSSKSSNRGRQQRSLGSVPAPQFSDGLPKISQRGSSQRPLVTFSAIAPRKSPVREFAPKRQCCSLNVLTRSQLRLIRPIARRPEAATRLSLRCRISSRNSFSSLSAKRSAFTPAPRIGGCHKASLMRRSLDKCLMARSLPEALSASAAMVTRENVRVCQSQPCFNLFVALTDPPLSSNDNEAIIADDDDDDDDDNFSITGRSCLPRESAADASTTRHLSYWAADRPFCDLDIDQMEKD